MIVWRIFLLLGFFVFCVNAGIVGPLQSVQATGRLSCGTKSVRDVKVELWEEDTDKFISVRDPDDLLNSTISNAEGAFTVYGEDKEVTAIEPYLIITHSCDNGEINPKCTITDEYPIPKEFIGKTYDMCIVSLSIAGKNHKKRCNN